MTILRTNRTDPQHSSPGPEKLSMAEILDAVTADDVPLRFTAFDGSATGPEDAPYGLDLKSPRGASYLATAPGDLGMARAYVAGDLDLAGVHPGDPYELLDAMGNLHFRMPPPKTAAAIARSLGVELLKPPPPPPQEALPALAPGRRRPAAQQDPRRRGDPPPLRRVQHVLRVRPRARR